MNRQYSTDVLVIGTGPAGIAAAIEAARAGADTTMVDSFHNSGGQFWMQSPVRSYQPDEQMRKGAGLIAECERLGVKTIVGAEVWGILPKYRVFLQDGLNGQSEIDAKVLIVCTGAHDIVLPFAGWTLPGVMTAGAGQRYVKLNAKSPGNNIVLAGSGIFLWAVAATIIKSGGNLQAMIESNLNRFRTMSLVTRYPERWGEAWRLFSTVVRGGVRQLYGYRIKSAKGDARVESVTVQSVGIGKNRSHTDQELETDCLLVSHGFRPITEITALLRCAHQYDIRKGGWYCSVDPATGCTSVENVYAAGEICGVAGAQSAFIQGALAGIAASEQLGFSTTELSRRRAELYKQQNRTRKFADELARLFEMDPESIPSVSKDTLVCRCEGVTWGEVLCAWNDGAENLQAVKYWTRVGMGRCQGRICGPVLSVLLANQFKMDQANIGFNQPRLPIRPVSVNTVHTAFSDRSKPNYKKEISVSKQYPNTD